MENIYSWAITVCISVLCACVLNILAPNGKMKKIFHYVLGLFLFLSFLSPLQEIDISSIYSDILSYDEKKLPNEIGLNISEVTQQYFHDNITALIENELQQINITPVKTEIFMDTSSPESISITKAVIYIKRSDASNKARIASRLIDNLGIQSEIYILEEQNE